MDKARKMHMEGYNPYAVAQRLQELEEVRHAVTQVRRGHVCRQSPCVGSRS
jgi:hypothetical protein